MQLSQKELAEALGLSPRRIRQLSADHGLFRVREDKKYNLAECVQDYLRFKIDAETSRGNDLDYWEEKAQHEQAKRKITEMKLSRMKRESFDASDVEDVWAALILGFREELQALPHKLAPMLIGLDDMSEIDRTLESEIDGALLALSQFDLSKIESSEDMTEDDEDEQEYSEGSTGTSTSPPAGKKANGQRVGSRKPKSGRR